MHIAYGSTIIIGMETLSHEKLSSHLKSGYVYRREDLLPFSKAVDRDLSKLLGSKLEKVGAGLYYSPATSRFGRLPPDDEKLVAAFLRNDPFLLYSWNQYNSLGLGSTQLYNRMTVYNRKRHGEFTLGGKTFDFRRPTRGFPTQLSREFLLVDLLNNLKELDEDLEMVKRQVVNKLSQFNAKKLLQLAKQYGKVATSRFLQQHIHA